MIIRGPFILKWGGNTLEDIETVDVDYENNSENYEANSGHIFEINKSIKLNVRLTFLATDIPSLAAVLPQYFVPADGQLANGDVVVDERGAIDILTEDCDTDYIYNDLEIISCGDPTETIKVMHARTIVERIEVGKIRKVVIKFIGEPEAGQSIAQLIGDQGEADFFQLDNDELFLLDDGNNLIL